MTLEEENGTVAGPVGGVDLFLVVANVLLYECQLLFSHSIMYPRDQFKHVKPLDLSITSSWADVTPTP